MFYSIEGNIGSGKSTLIEILKNQKNILFLPEPVDSWNEIKDTSGVTILEKYYQDQKRYAFPFQMMAYITRINLIKNMNFPPDSIVVSERSIYTDREIFAKMLYESGDIGEIEYQIYLKYFEDIKLDGIIYVKTTPDICLKRIEKRNRKGEETIPLCYLANCHSFHEKWIKNTNVPILFVDGNREGVAADTILKINDFVKNN